MIGGSRASAGISASAATTNADGERGEIVVASAEEIERAAALMLRQHGVIAYPTETCYGLAAAAGDEAALDRLLRIKGRAASQPISVLVADESMLATVAVEISPLARQLMQRHWPGALTLVLPAAPGIDRRLVNAQGGVGVRISSDPVAQRLVRAIGQPISATSANRSGDSSPRSARAAALEGVALVLDDGPRTQRPTTLVDLSSVPRLLRQGAVNVELL